jgi:hypothetical protein
MRIALSLVFGGVILAYPAIAFLGEWVGGALAASIIIGGFLYSTTVSRELQQYLQKHEQNQDAIDQLPLSTKVALTLVLLAVYFLGLWDGWKHHRHLKSQAIARVTVALTEANHPPPEQRLIDSELGMFLGRGVKALNEESETISMDWWWNFTPLLIVALGVKMMVRHRQIHRPTRSPDQRASGA